MFLDKNTFETYKGFNKYPLDDSERFYDMPARENEYWPVRNVEIYSLNNLPSPHEFVSAHQEVFDD